MIVEHGEDQKEKMYKKNVCESTSLRKGGEGDKLSIVVWGQSYDGRMLDNKVRVKSLERFCGSGSLLDGCILAHSEKQYKHVRKT
jgi:hypothetical protein